MTKIYNKVADYTVAELIKALKQFPQDLPVFVSGYEDGFENIQKPQKINLEHKADNKYWEGEFQEVDQQNTKAVLESVVLRRVVRDV